jgi:hypothetical protein
LCKIILQNPTNVKIWGFWGGKLGFWVLGFFFFWVQLL